MSWIISFLICFLLLSFGWFLCNYLTHIWMVQSYRTKSKTKTKIITFSEFLKEFKKYNWYIHQQFDSSYFLKYTDSNYDNFYVHADIICINGQKYVLEPISYIIFSIWKYKTQQNCNYEDRI